MFWDDDGDPRERLERIRAALLEDRDARPGVAYTSATHANAFIGVLDDLEDVMGDEWWIALVISGDLIEDAPVGSEAEYPSGIVDRGLMIERVEQALNDIAAGDENA